MQPYGNLWSPYGAWAPWHSLKGLMELYGALSLMEPYKVLNGPLRAPLWSPLWSPMQPYGALCSFLLETSVRFLRADALYRRALLHICHACLVVEGGRMFELFKEMRAL